ncbi:hypothetical protein [Natrinema salaciae]|nr:hypothetical protein [Natrinema salaciae]
MDDNNPTALTRRTAIKSVGTASIAGLGITLGTGSAAATPSGPEIRVTTQSSGSYVISTDASNVEAGGSATRDNIQNTYPGRNFHGDIEGDETHIFYTDSAVIQKAHLQDSVFVDVYNTGDENGSGALTVEARDTEYHFYATGDVVANGDAGEINNGNATAVVDGTATHDYFASGEIGALTSIPRSSTANVTFTYDI